MQTDLNIHTIKKILRKGCYNVLTEGNNTLQKLEENPRGGSCNNYIRLKCLKQGNVMPPMMTSSTISRKGEMASAGT